MALLRARLKNVVVTGIIVCCALFLWMLGVSKQDGAYEALMQDRYTEMQNKLQRSEIINRQRLSDLQILRSQFNVLVNMVTNNSSNSSMKHDFTNVVDPQNISFTEQLGSLHLPSIFTYLPHLTGHPESLKPVFKMSKNRYGASIVMGIPTIRRENVDYLSQTVKSLIDGMTPEEQNMCLIIVFVAEPWDKPYAEEVGQRINSEFPEAVHNGLLEVISPPAEFYPDIDHLKLTFGDNQERVRWRTKQNLDFTFLMLYARSRGFYYLQLEDDVVAKPGYISIMKTYADQQKSDDWVLLEFSALGFIGKMFKSSQIPVIVEFFLMFHKDKPIDWLLDHYLNVKVCSPEKDKKHCARMISEVRKRFKPSLFQHVGTHSSLKGKTQKLKDKDFGKQAIYRAHVNPAADLTSTIKAYQKYYVKKVYIGEDIFWGLSPVTGDTVDIKFNQPIEIESYLFRSGNVNHPDDKFKNAVVEILKNGAKDDEFEKVGEFGEDGLAEGTLPDNLGLVKAIRLKVLKGSDNWVILSEVHVVPRKSE
ncbi:hypothetical protein ACF0H5_010765 [Mactra antiquata]